MHKIYQNFDKLDVAFQGAFPQHILEALERAKFEAQEKNERALTHLGKNKIKVHVAQTGSSQGFTYIFDTGPDGEKWAVVKSQDTSRWNISVSISSMGLALHGYEGMKKRLYWLLEKFEVKAPTVINPETGKPFETPVEAISRFDYCIDFKTDKFEPVLDNFIGYRVKKKKINGSFSANKNGKRVETITVGKLPNRQVIIYDKIREIKSKPAEKAYWWEIWNIVPDTFTGQIWRVEARAGKKEVKDYWNIRSFEDLEAKSGDVIAYILDKYRYAIPNPEDRNKARWKNAPFWDAAIDATKETLAAYSSNAARGKILRGTWEEKRNSYINNITGNAVGLAALAGVEMTSLPDIFDQMKEHVQNALENESEAIAIYTKFRKAEERFAFFNNQSQEI